jgi:hypothetical protein
MVMVMEPLPLLNTLLITWEPMHLLLLSKRAEESKSYVLSLPKPCWCGRRYKYDFPDGFDDCNE